MRSGYGKSVQHWQEFQVVVILENVNLNYGIVIHIEYGFVRSCKIILILLHTVYNVVCIQI